MVKRKCPKPSSSLPNVKRESPICQVEGCGECLQTLREYHKRYKICEFHLKQHSLVKDGKRQRFCQQCGRHHELTAFDGDKRSCRVRLQRHNARRRKKCGAKAVKPLPQADTEIEEPSTPLAAEGTGSSARKNLSSLPLQRTVNATVCGAECLQEFLARTGFSEDLTPFYLGRPLQAVCSSKDQEGRGTVWSSQVRF